MLAVEQRDGCEFFERGGKFMGERLTWDEMQEKYPDMWLGLVDVKYVNDDGISVESAVVKYTNKTKTELGYMALAGEIVPRYTTPDSIFQLGAVTFVI